MKILIVSDTHGIHRNYDKVLEREGKIDMLFHLGDAEGGELYVERTANCPVHIVAGNNDVFSNIPFEEVVKVGYYTFFLTHGHRYFVSMDTRRLKQEALKRKAQIVVYGHTHKPEIDKEGPVICLNPGSLSLPRQSGRRPTYIVMEIKENGALNLELKTL